MEDNKSKHEHHVFISYSHKDNEIVEKLVSSLSKQGLSTWLDTQHLTKGEDWDSQIKDAIIKSQICLVLLNRNSDPLKPKISKEWSAIQECLWKRQDLYVFIVDFKEVETPTFLNNCDRLTFKSYKYDFDALAKQISLLISRISHQEPLKDKKIKRSRLSTSKRFSEIVDVLHKEK